MREPDLEIDGWCLEDGESLHREAPETFWQPDVERREALQPGDLAKPVFRISVDNDEEPVAVERMWVLVRGRVGENYFGVLDNDSYAIEENDEFWSGIELPFSARHVIDIDLPMNLRAQRRLKHQDEHGHATDSSCPLWVDSGH